MYINPLRLAAANFDPSDDIAIQHHGSLAEFDCCVHVTPESAEVTIFVFRATAASLVPSEEDAIDDQTRAPEFREVHVTPESVDV